MPGGPRGAWGAALWGRVPGGTWERVFAPTGGVQGGQKGGKDQACMTSGTWKKKSMLVGWRGREEQAACGCAACAHL